MSGLGSDQMGMIQAQALIFKKFAKIADHCFREVVKYPGSALSDKEKTGLDACVDQQMAVEDYLVQKLQDHGHIQTSS